MKTPIRALLQTAALIAAITIATAGAVRAQEIDDCLKKPVVQRLLQLIQFRNECSAFEGEFSVADCEDHKLILGWVNKQEKAFLNVDLFTKTYKITWENSLGETLEFVP